MVNLSREREDLRPEFDAHIIECVLIVYCDQANGEAEVSEPAGPTNSVEVGLSVAGEVKVNDYIHGLHVNTARAEVGRHEVSAVPASELVEHLISVLLGHPRVDEERRVPHLCDGASEPLDSLQRVAEDHRLVNPEVVKERFEAVEFLPLLHKRVVLRDALEGELLHEVDRLRLRHVSQLEVPHGLGERRREQHDLPRLGEDVEELLDDHGERPREQAVGLVQDEHRHAREVRDLLLCEVEDAPRRRHDDVHRVVEPHDVVLQRGPPRRRHHLRLGVPPQVLAHLRCLEDELARGDQDEDLDLVEGRVDAVQGGDQVRRGLPGAVLGASNDVLAVQGDGDSVLLDG